LLDIKYAIRDNAEKNPSESESGTNKRKRTQIDSNTLDHDVAEKMTRAARSVGIMRIACAEFVSRCDVAMEAVGGFLETLRQENDSIRQENDSIGDMVRRVHSGCDA
jgi:hypothetical protein